MKAARSGPWETGAYAVVRWNSVPARSVVARVRRPPSADIFVCATRVREASVDSVGLAASMAVYGMKMAVPPRSSALGAYEMSAKMRKWWARCWCWSRSTALRLCSWVSTAAKWAGLYCFE